MQTQTIEKKRYPFKFVKPVFKYPVSVDVRDVFKIQPIPMVSEWVDKNINLVSGAYTNTGKASVWQWQKEPLDSVLKYPKSLFLGPVQSGKSWIADMIVFFAMALWKIEGMVIYCNDKTARKVFKRRIRPMITGNAVLRKLWSGKDDDLAIDNLQLKHCFWGIGSAGNRNDIASFPGGCIVWSEVSKAEVPKDKEKSYDIMSEIVGRQEAYSPFRRKIILETSPNIKGDPMYSEVFKSGTGILVPHVPCPHCGEYQVLTDSQIKLRKIGAEEPDHDPIRIRIEKENAVFYECLRCRREITENHRPKIFEKVVWAMPEIEERVNDRYTFRQEAEKILKDGTIIKHREKMLVPCYNWNRLVIYDFYFWECLARFFESKRTQDKRHIYLNNDMARFYYPKSEKMSSNILEIKAMQSDYFMLGENAYVPKEVVFIVCSMDTQDDGVWYVFQGYGANCESWILRYGFIECAIDLDENQDYEISFNKIQDGLFSKPFVKKNGSELIEMKIMRGFMDRGGHRAALVEYVCDRLENFDPYIGSPRDDPRREMIYDTEKGYYIGKTEQISDIVGSKMKLKSWHLPCDTGMDFINQATSQYHYEEVDKKGNIRRKWKHGGADHLRDCLNMIWAAIIDLKMDTGLFNPNVCENLRNMLINKDSKKDKQKDDNTECTRRVNRGGSYFGGGRF
jgi:phage terminase large subunit GpA-like protein